MLLHRPVADVGHWWPRFDPQQILPEQMAAGLATRPESRLARAVLIEAFRDVILARRTKVSRHYRELAESYFQNTDRHWPFSFLNLCDHLNLEPALVRSRLDHLTWEAVRRGRR